ncbi:MAG: hypothetical protein A2758_02605 [Candidatus Zambryskibacteria bacterium RIFCSPHIGHO2_01_FULL_49_18]|uniref:Ribbon-helix-helix protein CopG domain-containing protein n=2 Tax=Candidatus Zambryskiibacteriota TaxID=1817925 RepID=A0A1G2T217_9BACT|nr:MAG: hypothetical protein A2758_02605 [Candidatus Zambryskibacteria bacterium RIFCSPHIGHO2_01_FULL_49_18]OHB04968.1 MAG: hypothetical protein A3A26_00100 [Candidatus Zambryskibacteria bacterium RIFCSPLOWO2_01_FULL_47_14]
MTKNVTISVPITKDQEQFIERRVESGLSANKAHAVRQALEVLREEDWRESLRRAEDDVRAGRIYYGDLDKLSRKLG